jgi:hypothetical protein
MLLKPCLFSVLCVGFTALCSSSVFAEDSIEFRTSYYSQGDSDDSYGIRKSDENSDVDETATIIEPIVIIKYDVGPRTNVSLQIDADFISSASIERLSNPPVINQGGATGDNRIGAKVGVSHQFEFADVRGSIGYSGEYEYKSVSVSGGFTKELFDRQSTLSVDLSFYVDEVDLITRVGAEPGGDSRTSINLDLGWSQLLTESSQIDFSLSFSSMDGFLQTAYHRVYLDIGAIGVEVDEVVPDSRVRLALGTVFKQYFDTRTSLHLGQRFYFDDWGIIGNTTSFELYQYVSESLYLGFRYRFYFQTEADFYEDRGAQFSLQQIQAVARPGSYTGFERTNDPDLSSFLSHTVGLTLGLINLEFGDNKGEISMGLDYMVRDDGLNAFWFSFGIKSDF